MFKSKESDGPPHCCGGPNLGGDPPAPSGTGTLLRLLATQKAQTRSRPSEDDHDLINTLLASSDGRCVQAPGEYSGCHNETYKKQVTNKRKGVYMQFLMGLAIC